MALLVLIALPVAAQNLTYTLNGVTFQDGATASGYVVFNPTTSTFTDFNLTTTPGTSDGMAGAQYTPQNVLYPSVTVNQGTNIYPAYYLFEFIHTGANIIYDNLTLNIYGVSNVLGVDQLHYGMATGNGSYTNSGEAESSGIGTGFQSRGMITGSMAVTAAPEPSQSAALGLGFLGVVGLTLRARKKSPAA